MTINFTLIIQIINFLIAYFIISKILLRPAISIIQKDEAVENEYLNLIKLQESKIKDKENLKQDLWNKSLKQFQKEKPILEIEPLKVMWKNPVAGSIPQNLKDEFENSINNLIINKVKYVEQ